ncbi:MAG: hypothetical protein DME34_08465 [Verrucomicrobia bacterium]|nr:MAG: hypothetical protein DME34_08465 [Verrucomicrobiota bacterium]
MQDRHRGKFPRDVAAIRQLPGIGEYTAHAIASFAFNQSVPIIEANTARVLARLFDLRIRIDSAIGRQLSGVALPSSCRHAAPPISIPHFSILAPWFVCRGNRSARPVR